MDGMLKVPFPIETTCPSSAKHYRHRVLQQLIDAGCSEKMPPLPAQSSAGALLALLLPPLRVLASTETVPVLVDRRHYVWATKPLASNTIETNEAACRARCLAIGGRCRFGTYLPHYGTCWISEHASRGGLVPCAVRCVGFERIQVRD